MSSFARKYTQKKRNARKYSPGECEEYEHCYEIDFRNGYIAAAFVIINVISIFKKTREDIWNDLKPFTRPPSQGA